MEVIQQVNDTEGKGMRGKSPWVQTQVIHMHFHETITMD